MFFLLYYRSRSGTSVIRISEKIGLLITRQDRCKFRRRHPLLRRYLGSPESDWSRRLLSQQRWSAPTRMWQHFLPIRYGFTVFFLNTRIICRRLWYTRRWMNGFKWKIVDPLISTCFFAYIVQSQFNLTIILQRHAAIADPTYIMPNR